MPLVGKNAKLSITLQITKILSLGKHANNAQMLREETGEHRCGAGVCKMPLSLTLRSLLTSH